MSARHKARKRALDILFEAQIRGVNPLDVLATRAEDPELTLNPYTKTLVEGVCANHDEIDLAIGQYSRDWDIDRMPTTDVCILRMGVFELQYVSDVPAGVAISEAVELAQDLSTDESAAFVNGLLGRIALSLPDA